MAGKTKYKPAPQGFATMTAERQREIASMGGRAAHAMGKAHQFTTEEARAAGRRSHSCGNAHEFTSEEAKIAGRKGAEAKRKKRAAAAAKNK